MLELTYHWEGDYLIPDLEPPQAPRIGKYGTMRHNSTGSVSLVRSHAFIACLFIFSFFLLVRMPSLYLPPLVFVLKNVNPRKSKSSFVPLTFYLQTTTER